MRVVVVHGIHTNDSDGWMHEIAAAFSDAGFEAIVWTYGYASALTTRFENPGRARKLADLIRPGDILVTHSNGGALAWMASQLGAPFKGWVSLDPALDVDHVAAEQVEWVNLYTNSHDVAVAVSSAWKIGNILPFIPAHPWGPQGRDGLSVRDPRYVRFRTEKGSPPVSGHSDILSATNLPSWKLHMVKWAQARINTWS